MIKKIFLYAIPLLLFPAMGSFTSCSTTKNLVEGEQLYVGIDDISYTDSVKKKKKRKTKESSDSVGVITSIGKAIDAVSDVLNGKGSADAVEQLAGLTFSDDKKSQKTVATTETSEKEAFSQAREEVEAVLAYAPNNALFGSSSLRSPFPVGLWFYNGFVGSRHKVGKWIYKNFAATPIYISTVNPEMRSQVATNTLRNYGYFSGRVTSEVLTQRNPRKAKVSYRVQAGALHRLDSIAYVGYSPSADSLLRTADGARLLHRGDAFSVVALSEEQTRIENLFRENGYYYYTSGYTTYEADTVQRKNYVQLRVQPTADLPAVAQHPWYIGRTYVTMRRNTSEVLDKQRRWRDVTFIYGGEKMPLKAGMWRRAIMHRSGELYALSNSNATLTSLGTMGVFSQMDVNYVPRDTASTCDTLDVYVSAVMDKLYDSSFEMNATLKGNQQVGPGVSYSIAKRNAFGGGEKVSFEVFGSYEWQLRSGSGSGSSLFNSYELGTELSLEFPRLVMPGNSRRRRRLTSSTDFVLSADWRNRAKFFQMINFGAAVTYQWARRSTVTHELTPFSLEYDKLLSTTASFDSIMNENPALYVSMRNQFVPSMSYTFTYTSPSTCRNPRWAQLSVKEAGNVVSGLYAAAGHSFSQRDKDLFGSPFAQYVRLTAEGHETFRLTESLSLATRLFAGAVFSYGNSRSAPYADLFYVGGANSIRAFTIRTIGPGSYHTSGSKYAYIDQTGDFKLEANAELRAHLFGSLYGALFLDAGNVWLLREDAARPGGCLSASTLKNIAVGTGGGLRYDLDFLVLRFDVGVGLHAPYETSRSGFYNLERFRDGFAFHFAIGYPF